MERTRRNRPLLKTGLRSIERETESGERERREGGPGRGWLLESGKVG